MSDRPVDPLVNGRPLSSLRVVDLKQELEKRGLSKSGSKKELIEKLKARLELDALQSAPAPGETGEVQLPNQSLNDEVQNDFVKAYLQEQQQSFQKQIELRQQVISEAGTITSQPISSDPSGAGGAEAEAPAVCAAPPDQEQSEAEDLTPTKQVRSSRSSRTSVSESPQPATRSLRSASSASTEQPVPQAEVIDAMPAAEASTPATSLNEKVPLDLTDAAIASPQKSVQVDAPEVQSKEEVDGPVPTESVVESVSDAGQKSEPASVVEPVSASDPQATPETAPEKSADDSKKETDMETVLPSKPQPGQPEDLSAPRKESKDVEQQKASSSEKAPVTPVKSAPIVESPEKNTPEVASANDSSSQKSADRKRLSDKKSSEDTADETKTKPRRKWGTGSDRQINRGISSSELNSLLPKKEKQVSVRSEQDELQGQALASENISMSGKFSHQPTNGPSQEASVSQQPVDVSDKVHDREKTTNGQVTETSESPIEAGPALNPVSNVIFVENLTRPFTIQSLHALLSTHGSIDKEKFWTDRIKSMCLVTYASVEEAEAARKALHGMRWPSGNPKTLSVDFSTEEEIEKRKKEAEKPAVVVRPTTDRTPNDKHDSVRKTTSDGDENSEKRVREWDREKISQSSPPPSKRTRRSPSPQPLSEQKQASQLIEVECPAKLLDDLFKKTSSSPVIYWLPLSESEAEERLKARKERQKLRQEEEAAREAERKNRRSSPPRRARSPPPPARSPRSGYRGGGDRYRRVSRSRSPIRHDARYRSPMRRSPGRRR